MLADSGILNYLILLFLLDILILMLIIPFFTKNCKNHFTALLLYVDDIESRIQKILPVGAKK
jgi:hypothetical protein